jgi:imidazolonepropionase-like amidohydrolase
MNPTVVIRSGQLFDGTGTEAVSGGELVIRDGRIVDGPAPPDAEIIDLSEAFVMPGLIDSHTHLSVVPGDGDQLGQLRQPAGRQALRVAGNLRRDIDAGTTTLRIMSEEDNLDFYTRDAIAAGHLEGPRLLVSGVGLAASNGHGRAKTSVDGVDAVRHATRENLHRGADFIKLFATGGVASGSGLNHAMFTQPEMEAAVDEAGRAGTYVAAHAHGGPGLQAAARAGVKTIEHAAVADEAEIELMLEHECWVVGTFSVFMSPGGIEQGDAGDPKVLYALNHARERVGDRMPAVLGSGVRFTLGTDSMHGMMAFEIQTAIQFGVEPAQALLAATARGAEMMGIENETGRLIPGLSADVIAVDGDPLRDPSAMERVVFVMSAGKRLRG